MEFRILGPLEIRHESRALPCKGAKQRLLLATLLLHADEVVSSDRLIDALWGERPPATAQKALQVHVSQLRRLLAPGLLVTRPPGYELRLNGAELDLQTFEAGVARGRVAAAQGRIGEASALLVEALSLWRGPPLADLAYDESLQSEIARLEELRLAATEDRVDADLTLGRHVELVSELDALAAEHPLRERIRGQLMLALYRSGRQAEALEIYAEGRRLLVDELGLEPRRELKELQQRILAHDPGLDPTPESAGWQVSEPDGLVGRERELTELTQLLERVLAGRGAVALIGGEPGIGKSRLADTLARRADALGMRVAVGRAWEAGGAPAFWPWLQALRSLRRDDPIEALPALVGEERSAETEGARFRMFESIAQLLHDTAATTPLALFLDDIHALDTPSLMLLRFIAPEIAAAPILVVACYRDSEPRDELAETLTELARSPAVHPVALKGLDAGATARLLAAAIGEPPPGELTERVHAETAGNPLFAGELGRLFAVEGVPADARAQLPIPDGVRAAIRTRLERQSESCRATLALASILGREFDLTTLGRLTELTEDELGSAIDEARAARLIGAVPGAGERLRFAHILVRDTLYEDLPAGRRVRLHLAVAEALEQIHGPSPGAHAAELAHHFIAAGSLGTGKAEAYAEQAGDFAARLYGYEEAARYYRLALQLIEERGSPDPAKTCDLALSLGNAESRAGRESQARAALARAAAIAEEYGWHDRLARAALAYVGRFPWARASVDPALVPLLERALQAIGESDPLARSRLLARLAAAIRDEAARTRRAALADEAVAIARSSNDPTTLAFALEGYWVAAEGADSAGDGLAIGDELVALGEQLADKERIFTGRDFRLNALWKRADRAGVDVEIEALVGLADELRQPAQRWYVGTAQVMLALAEGRFDDAEELIARTRAIGEQAEGWNAAVSERLQLFVLRREQGRLGEMDDALRRSIHEFPSLLRFRCALVHLHAELGDERAARAGLAELLAHDLGSEYVDAEWLFSMSLLPSACAFLDDTDAAARLYSLMAPYADLYTQAPVEATFGASARGLGVLAGVLRDYDNAERHLEAAIETERRMRALPWLAHAQHDLAATLRARDGPGDRERAAELAAAAVDGYRALGMDSWAERALGVV